MVELHELMGKQETRRRLFHTDKRVIAARKQYRYDIKNGTPEGEAWEKANKIYCLVRCELDKGGF